jgi:hypothetical protein
MKRALAVLILVGCSERVELPESMERGVAALRRLQEADGAWRSVKYADMKSGLPLTALAAYALSRLPGPPECGRAIEFLSKHLEPSGQVGNEYPNFTTGMTLRAFRVYRPSGWEEMTRRMAEYLVKAQETEAAGWTPEDPAYGGWGYGGLAHAPRRLLRQDISSTRFAIEALAEAGRIAEVRDKALAFAARLQNEDGGFCYSRALPTTNKAGEFQSYGSATADGVLALRALGEPGRSARAEAWLAANFSAERVPGFAKEVRVPWHEGILYYYLAAAAEAATDAARRGEIARKIRSLQAPDGSWTNSSGIMKEDEPVIATCFALLACAACGGARETPNGR